MASNIEDFLIRFVFEDEDVIKDIKAISKSMDRLDIISNKSSKRQQSQSQKKQQNLKRENSLLARQKQLQTGMGTITGISSTGGGNNEITLLRTQQQLRDRIAKADYLGLDTQRQKELLSSQRDLNALRKEELRLRQRINKESVNQRIQSRMSAVRSSGAFQTVSKMDNPRAAQYASEMQAALNRNTAQGERQFKALNRQLQQYSMNLRRVRTDAVNLQTVQKGLKDSTRNMIRTYASMFALLGATQSINRVGQEFEALQSGMLAAVGTMEAAGQEIAYLERLTSRLGLSLLDTSNAYSKLTYSAKQDMSTDEIRTLFTGLTEFGTVMGLDRERMKWSMMAVQQIRKSLIYVVICR